MAGATTKPKRHICSWEDCGKAFTRSDHLRRHMLNHAEGSSTCQRCRLHFKRPDLLDRHMIRHKQKDDEAGGEGLGLMETRKRMWRDVAGNIVAERPTIDGNDVNENPSGHQDYRANEDTMEVDFETSVQDVSQTLNPNNIAATRTDTQREHHSSNEKNINQTIQFNSFLEPSSSSEMYDFLANSSWETGQSQTSTNARENPPFQEIFNPDTASSFNMPFTTVRNYSWLLDASDEGSMNLTSGLGTSQILASGLGRPSHSTSMSPGGHPQTDNVYPVLSNVPSARHDLYTDDSRPGSSSYLRTQSHTVYDRPYPGRLQSPVTSTFRAPSRSASSFISSPDNSSILSDSRGLSNSSYTTINSSRSVVESIEKSVAPSVVSSISTNKAFRPSSKPLRPPSMDERSRQRVMDFIDTAKPKTPEGVEINRHHPLLSLPSLQQYSDLYWTKFNVSYPLLHLSTFETRSCETLLLLSIILLGATYGNKAAHGLAVCVHDAMRPHIFAHASFTAQPDLWMLQTILLVECFGKSRAGQKQHDMAQLFHGLLINLIRRSDCQRVRQPATRDLGDELNLRWRQAMDIEQKKRLAFLCFMWDTQHAILFSQSLCMSAFELQVSLPCSTDTWEAETAQEWSKHASGEKDISFLPVLKAYMNRTFESPQKLDSLSRQLILHGLMSISWDMKRRDQTSLGIEVGGMSHQNWQSRMKQSYDAWKADWDSHCMDMTLSISAEPELKAQFLRFTVATNAIYHAAQIALGVEILDLQIYVGARHIIGRPVCQSDYEHSCQVIRDWTQEHSPLSNFISANNVAWHAAHLLRDGIMNLDNWDVDGVFHYPWCLYLATLTCCAFHDASRTSNGAGSSRQSHARNSPSYGNISNASNNSMAVREAKSEMNAMVSAMTSTLPDNLSRLAGKYATTGLITVMVGFLSSVRWALTHEAAKVLQTRISER